LKKQTLLLAALSGLSVSLPGHAEEAFSGLTLGSMYHLKLEQTDNGLYDLPPLSEAKDSLNTGFDFVRLIAKGKLSDKTSLFTRYNFSNAKLERFYLTHKLTDNVSVLAGLQKARIFGWHRRISSGLLATESRYVSSSFRPFSNTMMVQLEATYDLGKFTVQVVEDYDNCNVTCDSWNSLDETGQVRKTQPGLLTEWIGNYGAFQPLVQYGLYDLGKNYTATVGLRYKANGVDVHADYAVDERKLRDESKRKLVGTTVHATYSLGNFTPYVHLSNFELETSSGSVVKTGVNTELGKLDREGQTVALGAYYEGIGTFARPYLSVSMKSGDFEVGGEEKTLTTTSLTAGLVGIM